MNDTPAEKPAYWGVMPAEVRYSNLPATAKVLYTEISALTTMDGFCLKDNAYFCSLYKISERTLQGHLQRLEKAGYIAILDGDGGHGRRRIYAGINPLASNPAKNCGVTGEPRKKLRGNPAENCGVNNVIQDISQDNPPTPQRGAAWEPEMFERFWRAYPCKKDKASARREWDRLKPDRKLMQTMSAALDRAKSSDEWQRGIGIPYACRWISKRRWEDEPDMDLRDEATDSERRLVGGRC